MARYALTHANGKAESVGESWCRAQLIDGGLPTPQLQVYYQLPSQDAWVDLDWERKLIVEFDGMCKYRVPDGANAAEATRIIQKEKRRQDELEATGPKMLRFWWAQLEGREVVGRCRYWLNHLQIHP